MRQNEAEEVVETFGRHMHMNLVAVDASEKFLAALRPVLERMIADRVQLQLAKESGLRVDDADLERAINRIAEQNKITMDVLRKTLENDGVPYAKFREDIRNEIILSRLREREAEEPEALAACLVR